MQAEERTMKVLFAASEAVPFIKTGGLADVVGALPRKLRDEATDVRVILPKYRLIAYETVCRMTHVCDFTLDMNGQSVYCGVDTITEGGVPFYFIDNLALFGSDRVYTGDAREGFRFAFFARAVLEALPRIGFFPDVLHCHDWQTGMIPVLLNGQYAADARYQGIRTVFTIHNLKFQGLFSFDSVRSSLGLNDGYFTQDNLEFYGVVSYMKAGLVFSNCITTVSPAYAEEIRTPYFGERMDGILRKRQDVLTGILNGIDTKVYNPHTDPALAARYDRRDRSGKTLCKAALQEELGLCVHADVPLIGMVTRLTPQKGLDLVTRVLDDIMRTDAQMAVLGTGDANFEDFLRDASRRYPGRVATVIRLDEALSRRVYAGSDLFFMPSLFEPCGLSQLIALRYGSVPVVRETGGLRDTIVPYNQYADRGNGFSFRDYNAHEMLYTLERACRLYSEEPERWSQLVDRGMAANFSWTASAKKYQQLYMQLLD